MKPKLLLTLAVLLLPLVAFADDDVVWERNLGAYVYRVDYVLNGSSVLAQTEYGNLCLLDANNGEIVKEPKLPYEIGSYALMSDKRRILIPGYRIFDLANEKVVDSFYVGDKTLIYHNGDTSLPYFEKGVGTVLMSPDDKYLIAFWSGRYYDFYPHIADVSKIIFIDAAERKLIKIMENRFYREFDYNHIVLMNFSPDSKYLAVGFNDGIVELWDAKSFEKIKQFEKHGTGQNFNCEFSPDSKKLISMERATNTLRLYDVDKRTILKTWLFDEAGFSNGGKFLTNNLIVCGGSNPKMKIISLQTFEPIKEYDYYGYGIALNGLQSVFGHVNKVVSLKLDTTTTSINHDPIKNIQELYPNPTTQKVLLKYTIQIPNKVNISILALNGKTIKTLKNNLSEIGTFEQEFDVSFLANGFYFIRITAKNYSVTYKLVKE